MFALPTIGSAGDDPNSRAVQEEIWTGDTLQFRVSALGQSANGTIEVAEDVVHLKVFLPWLLAKVATLIQPLVRKEGTLMLEKK